MVVAVSHMPADLSEPLVELAVGELLRTAATEFPERIFLVDGVSDPAARTRMTYRQVLVAAERVAAFLAPRFGPDEHIAIWAPNSLSWVLVQLGAALAGVPVVMINPALRRDELSYILRQSETVGLFLARSHRDNPMLEIVEDLRAELPRLRETFLLETLTELVGDAPVAPLAPVSSRHAAIIQYTSGTTGSPKGAVLTHFGIVNDASFVQRRLGLPQHSTWLLSVPMFHTGGSVYHLLCSLWNRGVLIVMREFDPKVMIDLIEQEGVHFFSSVPTGHLRIVEHPSFAHERVSSLITVGSGGATVPEDLVTRLEREYGAQYVVTFGQTETSASVTHTRPHDQIEQKASTIGFPLPHIEVKLVDPATSQVVARALPGEICVRGFCVMREYFNMPEQTAEAIDADGWLHTGDIGVMRDDGYLQIAGRLKDMIIRGGENIFPREIEDVLSGHDAVAEAAVIGIPDREWGEQVAAVVRLNDCAEASAAQLEQYLRERLARHKAPRHWRFVRDFPQTPSGKIQKFKLKDLFSDAAPAERDRAKESVVVTAGSAATTARLNALDGLSGRPIGDVLRHAAQAFGAAPFLVSDGTRLSFAELDAEVDRAAAGLLGLGVARGDHVGLWLGNSVEWVVWFLACARIGAAVVPISTRYKSEEMAYVVEHSQCKALIVSAPRWNIDFVEMLRDAAPELAGQVSGALDLQRFPELRHVLVATGEAPAGTRTLTSLLGGALDRDRLAEAERAVEQGDLLLISYTSGTTGAPKGVMHDHRVVAQATRVGLALHMEPGDGVLGHMPFYHVAGLFMALIPAMVLGSRLVILQDWDVGDALRLIQAERIAIFGGIPTHFLDVASSPRLADHDVSSLKSAWIGGSSVTREMFERVRTRIGIPKLLSTYGMTENTISTTFNRWDDPPDVIYDNKAPVLADCEVAIFDPETCARLPVGQDGEIWCRGVTVMLGYYRNPEATREAVTPEGWLRTGDIGRFDAAGYLSITGRRKEMFKIGGTNAYPIEIEQHLAKLDDILMSAVVGVPDDRLGEVGYAFVQLATGSELTERDVVAHCRGRIADYKAPRYVRFVDEFPRTPSGKIKKFELGQIARGELAARKAPA